MREGMEANREKSMREAVELDRAKILNNGSARGTNDAVLDLSVPRPMSELFNEKKTGMTGIERKYKDREKEKISRAMREEVAKSVRDKFCATLQHRSEAMRKDHGWLTREALESMRDQYKENISALREGHGTGMRRLR